MRTNRVVKILLTTILLMIMIQQVTIAAGTAKKCTSAVDALRTKWKKEVKEQSQRYIQYIKKLEKKTLNDVAKARKGEMKSAAKEYKKNKDNEALLKEAERTIRAIMSGARHSAPHVEDEVGRIARRYNKAVDELFEEYKAVVLKDCTKQ